MLLPKKILIVDGLNQFLRAFARNPHRDSNGEHCGGIVGFLRILKGLVKDHRPHQAVVVWDGKGGSLRKRHIFKDYKEGRTPHVNRGSWFGDDFNVDEGARNLQEQYARTKDYVEELGVTQVDIEGVEADDVIGFLVGSLFTEDEITIVSSDKDFLQLASERVFIWSPMKHILYDAEKVTKEYSVPPHNFALYKSLMGDKSDNIAGFPGIGKKTAVTLFPMLTGSHIEPQVVLEHAKSLSRDDIRLRAVADGEAHLKTNMRIIDLSSPLLSADEARSIRIQATQELRCRSTSAHLHLMRDGIALFDNDLLATFEWLDRRHQKTKEEQ